MDQTCFENRTKQEYVSAGTHTHTHTQRYAYAHAWLHTHTQTHSTFSFAVWTDVLIVKPFGLPNRTFAAMIGAYLMGSTYLDVVDLDKR